MYSSNNFGDDRTFSAMGARSVNTRISALAYLYDHRQNLPEWFRELTPEQLADIAAVMTRWDVLGDNDCLPLEEVERRAILRAIRLCGGNISDAAHALKIGKTTIYRKLERWGYTDQSRILQAQASVLAGETGSKTGDSW